jgi:hypothetical protein
VPADYRKRSSDGEDGFEATRLRVADANWYPGTGLAILSLIVDDEPVDWALTSEAFEDLRKAVGKLDYTAPPS